MLTAIHSPARIKNMKIILDFDYFPKNDLAVEKYHLGGGNINSPVSLT